MNSRQAKRVVLGEGKIVVDCGWKVFDAYGLPFLSVHFTKAKPGDKYRLILEPIVKSRNQEKR